MKLNKKHISNIILVLFVALMIIPQTRTPIQVGLHSILGLFSPSVTDIENRNRLSNYDWKLSDNNGNQLDFNETKGKVIFVNLWATWCPPCIAEMPSMQKIYEDYGNKVTFLFVSNEEKKITESFLKRKELNLPIYSPLTSNPVEIFSKSIPATYIIDKNGFIVVEKIGAANWNSDSIRELLDSLLIE